jgi:hypothetical protein
MSTADNIFKQHTDKCNWAVDSYSSDKRVRASTESEVPLLPQRLTIRLNPDLFLSCVHFHCPIFWAPFSSHPTSMNFSEVSPSYGVYQLKSCTYFLLHNPSYTECPRRKGKFSGRSVGCCDWSLLVPLF